ncbi:MAG: aspartate/glutamate racemase family protein [Rhodospirillaceae bacterium]|nr:aspartate/glutamate racemase family protein [Rhodospirillaceae bacterium]MDE0000141.1 aspartate/glutamate racemase family protein [Rhodospirillaceae bacterium]
MRKARHIRMISPVVPSGDWSPESTYLETLKPLERDGLKLSSVFLDRGPQSIEYRVEEAMLVPDLVDKALAAERQGVDGLVIDCMADPGVDVLRECVAIPVLGPGRLSMQMATLLGRRFSILVELDVVARLFEEEVQRYGLSRSFASSRVIDIPVLEIDTDIERTTALLVDAGELAVRQDHADVLVLGCTRFSPMADALTAGLKARGLPVQVLNPNALAINMMVALLDSGLSHSKIAYPYPAGKKIVGFGELDFDPARSGI